jgi:hypothetical protein
MTESGVGLEPLNLSMSVVGYELTYTRRATDQPTTGFTSVAKLSLSVTGAMLEHHQNRPVRRVVVDFSDSSPTKLGHLHAQPGQGGLIFVELPAADFAAIWATLRLDRVAMLECTILRPSDDVGWFRVRSQGSLFPLFGV